MRSFEPIEKPSKRHCQIKLGVNWLIGGGQDSSRCKLTPSRESGSAVLLEDISAVEVTVVVEVIVDSLT